MILFNLTLYYNCGTIYKKDKEILPSKFFEKLNIRRKFMKERLTLKQLEERINEWNKAVIVFTEDSFDKPYTEQERSYEIRSDAKYFDGSKLGNSLFGNCLDGKDHNVRLDWYLGEWHIEYCYIVE